MRRALVLLFSLIASHALAFDADKASRYPSPDMYRPNVDQIIVKSPGSVIPAPAITGGTIANGAISGGTINGAAIGVTTPAPGVFTTIQGDTSGANISSKLGNLQRRLDDKLSDMPMSVEDYRGGQCAGAADDTCAIKATVAAACSQGSAEARLHKSGYVISDTITLPDGCNSVWLHGVSAQGTAIRSTATDRPIIQVSGIGNRVGQFLLAYTGAPTTNAIALSFVNAAAPTADNFITYNTNIGVKVSGGSALFMSNFSLSDHITSGFWADNTTDVFGTNFLINAGDLLKASSGNIRLTNHVEALTFVNGDVLLGKFSLITSASNNIAGERPAYINFIGVFLDSARQGSVLDALVFSNFTASWISAGKDNGDGQGSFSGITLLNTDSVSFTSGTRAFNCGGDGIVVSPQAKRTVINAVNAESNGQTTANGSSYGVRFQAGATDFTMMASTGSNQGYVGGKQNALAIVEGGPSDRYTIMGNLGYGNVNAAAVLDFGTGTNKLVQGNW